MVYAGDRKMTKPILKTETALNVFSDIDRYIGRRIGDIRRRRKITAAQLAEHLGITAERLKQYETGARAVSARLLAKIMEFFRVPAAYFLDGAAELALCEA